MELAQVITERTSVRSYTDKCPSREELMEIVEAARQAPSATNKQPWHFYVVTNAAMLETLYGAYGKEWIRTARAIIVAAGNHNESWHRSRLDNKDHCDIDLAIAIEHMALRATDLGLGSCWICSFDAPAVSAALKLAAGWESVAMLPIGYPAVDAVAHTRKAFDEIATFID